MATQTVTISRVNGAITANPDTVIVDPGDTIVWQLDSALHWPQPPNPVTNAIWHDKGQSIISTLGLHFVAAVPPSTNRTVQGTVPLTAVRGSSEDYYLAVTNSNSATAEVEAYDPKIKVRVITPE